ncbi:Permease of the drug/metabolite transporter (DMT) superfamily [Paenibacillus pasadenensis]|uniref:Permease of the drug/metabolite transporter (DMT) superfamily n=1 Tax=Paenibacillus pasadenensis TaxID=217090 RepID=A0A2N5N7H3_9BACL|nr:DMT family transporter [Paenibacillus pasadenensis]PLT46301.1 Permease of the drug/metabolite transporter (DMT) superfamily [Paenibacillus pasadenensis]
MDRSSRTGMLLLLASFSLAGSSVIAAALLGRHLQPFTLTAASLLLSLLCLLPALGRSAIASLRRLSRGQWLQLAGQAAFGIVLFRVCLQLGLERTSSAEAGIMIGATPALTVGIAWLLLRERSGPARLGGVLATVLGVMLIQGAASAGGGALTAAHLAGNLWVLGAAGSEALFSVLSRWTAAGRAGGRAAGGSEAALPAAGGQAASGSGAAGEPSGAAAQPAEGAEAPLRPALQTALVAGMALLLSLPLAAFERPLGAFAALGATEWLALLWYGPVVTAAAFGLWYAGIRRCPASTAAACSGMMPFSALLLSVLVLGEHAGWTQWSGGLLVMLGMALIGRSPGSAGKRSRGAGSASAEARVGQRFRSFPAGSGDPAEGSIYSRRRTR